MSTEASTGQDERRWPRAAASAAIFRGDAVLLVKRSKPVSAVSSLPGGHIEPGERAREGPYGPDLYACMKSSTAVSFMMRSSSSVRSASIGVSERT